MKGFALYFPLPNTFEDLQNERRVVKKKIKRRKNKKKEVVHSKKDFLIHVFVPLA